LAFDFLTVEVKKYHHEYIFDFQEMPPHIFAIGQKAYGDLKRGFETTSQSVIVSGESGAGKVKSKITVINTQLLSTNILIKEKSGKKSYF